MFPRVNKALLIIAGTLAVFLGVIGIFVPLLPTVPFLLLASYCYAKSSEKFYQWFINNRWFGKMIRDYKEGKGVPLVTKVFSVGLLWIVIGSSIVFIVDTNVLKVVLFVVGLAVTIHLVMMKSHR